MEAFYLQHAARYESLVQAFDPYAVVPHFSRQKVDANEQEIVAEEGNPNMIIACRIRPMLDSDLEAGFPCAVYPRKVQPMRAQTVDLHDLYHQPRGKPSLKSSRHLVDRLYGADALNEDIYEELVADLVSYALCGGVGTLFAYGQTGSGKTFTISHLQKLAAIGLLKQAKHSQKGVYMTVVDLAGNSAFDLLDSRKPIAVREDSQGATQLAGAEERRISVEGELLHLLDQATSFRHTAATLKNDASSRSHSVCRIRIADIPDSSVNNGYLYLVDLAGSEAARDVVEHGADRMRETREINMSLSVLKECIRGKAEMDAVNAQAFGAKAKARKMHIPLRQSALTRVLKHVFDPQASRTSKTVVIACVNPSLADVSPSKNTLRYAELLRTTLPPGSNPSQA